MTERQIEAIAEESAENLKVLIMRMIPEINAAELAATEQAQEDGKDAVVVTLNHAIKLDIGNARMSNAVSVSARHKRSFEGEMPDPNQPKLL